MSDVKILKGRPAAATLVVEKVTENTEYDGSKSYTVTCINPIYRLMLEFDCHASEVPELGTRVKVFTRWEDYEKAQEEAENTSENDDVKQ